MNRGPTVRVHVERRARVGMEEKRSSSSAILVLAAGYPPSIWASRYVWWSKCAWTLLQVALHRRRLWGTGQPRSRISGKSSYHSRQVTTDSDPCRFCQSVCSAQRLIQIVAPWSTGSGSTKQNCAPGSPPSRRTIRKVRIVDVGSWRLVEPILVLRHYA
ncbi:hypothetical protein PYCCODRAFT_729366 [Trametes coccinea BRFM310]|uniref:Uncharacterized protein n=1 Tax=Trametes coccinea (strain BRFM310) TaxID=1353009 RepID=A0A1Y2IG33_TRAC3|nr:hypothetical protein PYCCODRAFT_729366 [Trametes coccinea BRFM310]